MRLDETSLWQNKLTRTLLCLISTYLIIDLKLRVENLEIDSFYKLLNTNKFFCTRNVNYFINNLVYLQNKKLLFTF